MLAICQLIIINLLPDQYASFCIAIAYIYTGLFAKLKKKSLLKILENNNFLTL